MGSKINVKARINRHSRILKNDFSSGTHFSPKKSYHGYNIVLVTIVFLIPIYPVFSSFIHTNTASEFKRDGVIDEDTIITSFYKSWDSVWESDFVVESKDSFLSINTTLEWARNSFWSDIVEYEVKDEETIAVISEKFKVSKETIYWANDLEEWSKVKSGDTLKVPPVSGMIHTVAAGETISSIAQKYKIDESKILTQNLMNSDDTLSKWKTLIVPGAVKPKPKPKPVYTAPTYARSTSSSSGWYSFATAAKSEYVTTAGRYKLTPKPSYHTFYWGNCTWYVAKYKSVNWWGNANAWLRNARAKGHPTGNTPTLGSIVVFNGRGYNPRYGHVAIVMDVKSDHLIISDMNYRRLWEVTTRKIPRNDRAIMWYIYVD